jgi:hypothetical protein
MAREAFAGDAVCVEPRVHDQAIADNIAAPSRVLPNGACVEGYVRREPNPSDHVCVTPQAQAQTQADNQRAFSQVQPPLTPPTHSQLVTPPLQQVPPAARGATNVPVPITVPSTSTPAAQPVPPFCPAGWSPSPTSGAAGSLPNEQCIMPVPCPQGSVAANQATNMLTVACCLPGQQGGIGQNGQAYCCPSGQYARYVAGQKGNYCSNVNETQAFPTLPAQGTAQCPPGSIEYQGSYDIGPTCYMDAYCPNGYNLSGNVCVATSTIVCPPGTVQNNGLCICAAASEIMINGACCNPSQVSGNVCCPINLKPGPNGTCTCAAGQVQVSNGSCCAASQVSGSNCCPSYLKPGPAGTCQAAAPIVQPGLPMAQPPTNTTNCGASGLVPREAFRGDTVCVDRGVHDQTIADNLAAPSHTLPNGLCIKGYLWRRANPDDHVCVLPASREQAQIDNKRACPGGNCNAAAHPDCLANEQLDVTGVCCPLGRLTAQKLCCPPNYTPQPGGSCRPLPPPIKPPRHDTPVHTTRRPLRLQWLHGGSTARPARPATTIHRPSGHTPVFRGSGRQH